MICPVPSWKNFWNYLLLVPASAPGDLSPQIVFCKIWKFLSSVSIVKTVSLHFTQSREWILKHFLSFALQQITSASLLIFQGKSANPWDLRFLHLQAVTDNSLYTGRCVCLKSFKVIKMRRREAVKNQKIACWNFELTHSLGSPCYYSCVIICRSHYSHFYNGWLYQLNHIYSKWMHSIFC